MTVPEKIERELRKAIEEAFPAVSIPMEVQELKNFLMGMGQNGPSFSDVSSWIDLVHIVARAPNVDTKLALMEGTTWRALLPAWMAACLDPVGQHNAGLVAITVAGIQRPPVDEPEAVAIFEARVAGLTEGQRNVVRRWAAHMAKLPLFDDDPGLPARIDETWGGPAR